MNAVTQHKTNPPTSAWMALIGVWKVKGAHQPLSHKKLFKVVKRNQNSLSILYSFGFLWWHAGYTKRSFAIPVAASRSARNATAITWLVEVHLVAGGLDGCLVGCHVAPCHVPSIFDNWFLCSAVPLKTQIETAQRSSPRWLQPIWINNIRQIMPNWITSPSMGKNWKSLKTLKPPPIPHCKHMNVLVHMHLLDNFMNMLKALTAVLRLKGLLWFHLLAAMNTWFAGGWTRCTFLLHDSITSGITRNFKKLLSTKAICLWSHWAYLVTSPGRWH